MQKWMSEEGYNGNGNVCMYRETTKTDIAEGMHEKRKDEKMMLVS
jgi:hypothetical protein